MPDNTVTPLPPEVVARVMRTATAVVDEVPADAWQHPLVSQAAAELADGLTAWLRVHDQLDEGPGQ